jgi:signal transduction histidine kinase
MTQNHCLIVNETPASDLSAGAAASAGRGGGFIFRAGVVFVLLACLATVWLAHRQPWMGVAPEAVAAEPGQPAGLRAMGLLPAGSELLGLQGRSGPVLPLAGDDLMEEPDLHPTYEAWGAFYARQDALAAALAGGEVTLTFQAGGAQERRVVPVAPARPLSSLPVVFWFQLLVGVFGALIGLWAWGLRPDDPAARCLALTGVALLLAAGPAAVYGTRELALPADLFRALSTLNHLGTVTFGIGLVGIFLFHPQRLAGARVFWALAILWGLWGFADFAWWLPGPDWAMRLIVVTELLAAIGLGVWQWRRARGRPLERAALRWVLLSFLVGCGAFVVLMMGTTLLGWLPPLSQGYAFGFFLVMYVGLALGVRRYRLFDLDRWSLRVLMWVFGLLGIVLVDAALVMAHVNGTLSLAASILLCAAVYFPLRQWLWGRLSARTEPDFDEFAGRIVALALAPPAQRAALWQGFLGGLYAPLRIEPVAQGEVSGDAVLLEQGMGLQLPAAPGVPALRLWQRDQGRRLFSPRDGRMAERLLRLVGLVVQTREAQDRGAREERQRIAGDLHDDLGGKLLSIARSEESPRLAGLAREALEEMRLAVQGLMAAPAPAEEMLADWRRETVERATAAGLQVEWQCVPVAVGLMVGPRLRMQSTRMLREAVTNVIKHAGATRLRVDLGFADGALALAVADDGRGLAPAAPGAGGQGLASLQRRAQAVGGTCHIGAGPAGGTRVAIRLPLAPMPDNPPP